MCILYVNLRSSQQHRLDVSLRRFVRKIWEVNFMVVVRGNNVNLKREIVKFRSVTKYRETAALMGSCFASRLITAVCVYITDYG